MADRLTSQQRYDLMRRIKGTDTLPERLLSTALDNLGIAHTRNDATLPGTPDVAIHDRRVAVFVHGCFWHGCPDHYRAPKTRGVFWARKLERNKARDRRLRLMLRSLEWTVVELWEHEVKTDPVAMARLVASARSPNLGKGRPGKALKRSRRL